MLTQPVVTESDGPGQPGRRHTSSCQLVRMQGLLCVLIFCGEERGDPITERSACATGKAHYVKLSAARSQLGRGGRDELLGRSRLSGRVGKQ